VVALLIVARAYYPSEDAETGSGLIWVFGLLAASSVWVASMLFAGSTRLRWSWADAAVLALMVLVGMSASHAADRRPAITMAWEWGGLGLLYFLARNLPRTRAESATMAGAVVATAVAVSAYGLYQVPVEFPQFRRLYLARPDFVTLRMGFTPGTPAAEALKQRLLYSNEAFSTFALANSLAGFLVGPMALAFAVALENLRREGRGSRLVALAMAGVPGLTILACLILTNSRSAWVGLGLALLVLAWRARGSVPPKVLAVSVGGLAAILGALVVGGVATKQLDLLVITESPKSLRYRWEYWVGAWGVITDAPSPYDSTGLAAMPIGPGGEEVARSTRTFWFGLGPANFAMPYLRHKLPQASEEVLDPHNMVLEVWETAGVFAMLALLTALAIGLREMLGPPRPHGTGDPTEPEPKPDRPWNPSRDPGAPPARSGWLLWSAGLGWLGVWAMGKLNPMSQPDLLARWILLGAGWVLAVVMGSAIWRRRPIPGGGIGVAVLALAVNLLAAGGIGIPSVAMSLWCLLALGLNLRDDRPCGRLRNVGGLGPAILLACTWAALAGTFFGAVVPAWKSEAALEQGNALMALRPPAFEAARAAYTRAIEADHYSVKPWVALAELEFRFWQSPEIVNRKEPRWKRIQILLDDALDSKWRNPYNLGLRRRQAYYARAILHALPGDALAVELLDLKATIAKACRWSARIYPTSASIRAELAQASADIGFYPDAAREARQALLLDELTPHLDKKLAADLRARLKAQAPKWEELAKAPPPSPPSAAPRGPGPPGGPAR
jgi:O-antigen ligase